MSVPVDPQKLREAIADAGRPSYLLTVGEDARPHAVEVALRWTDDATLLASVGHRSLANAGAHPQVSLLWPPAEPGGYSLIADLDATSDTDGRLRLVPRKGVWHRPAGGGPTEDGCTSDCIGI